MSSANPLLDLGFHIPFDRIEAAHVEPAVDALLEGARAAIAAIGASTAPPTYANTLAALEDALDPLDRAMSVVGHLESVATTDALRDAYNEVQPKVSALYSAIPLDPALYRRLVAFSETAEAEALSPTKRRFLDKELRAFRRNGADLDEAGKTRLQEIDVELSKLTTKFAQNLLDETNAFELVIDDEARLSGLPESARAAARASAEAKGVEGWRFTLQAPSAFPVLSYLDDAQVRETVWRAYNTRASRGEKDNSPLIGRILELRREKAALLRYATFADYVLEERMAQNGARARRFVDDLTERTRAFFDRETAELEAFRRELEGAGAPPLEPWDVGYYAEKLRRARYDFDAEALRPYFAAEAVLDGLFAIVGRLYGVRVEPGEAPGWDPAVRFYRLLEGDALRGAFYVDLHPRENKRGGAWMSSFVTGGPEHGPHLGLFCANATPPVGDRPALLTHDEVETLFHEFGHLMHLLLSDVEVRSLAGTSVAWDFVELPSQVMENWTWEREALDLFAHHHESGAPIPDDLFEKMTRARTFRAASATMRQLGFASVDLALHVDYDPARDGEPVDYARRVMAPFAATPLPDDYAMICGFGHLFQGAVGYAAGYYSYKWAEVLDADVFTRFVEHGIFDAEVGDALRRKILSRGDSAPPEELFRDFMGREPSVDALLARSGLV
ncbi:MAG: M3 family metallopeptidase [Sandaracinaceae bacterium]|nr:M3 family metallopeptidase [Sandaracinaceae bacterium]